MRTTTRGKTDDTWKSGPNRKYSIDLRGTFAHYDDEDVWRASIATMSLFRTLATETAQRLELRYPTDVDANISDWVMPCEAGRR